MFTFNGLSSINNNDITLVEQQNKIKGNHQSFDTKYNTKLELVENKFQDYKNKILLDTNDKIDLLLKQQNDLILAGEKHKADQLNELKRIQIEVRQHEIKMNEIIVNKDTPSQNNFHLNYEWNKFEIFNAKIHKVDFNLEFETNNALLMSNNYNWIGNVGKPLKSDQPNSIAIQVSVPFLQPSQAPAQYASVPALSQPMPYPSTLQVSPISFAFPAPPTSIFSTQSYEPRIPKNEPETSSDSVFKFNPDGVAERLNSRLVFNENSKPLDRHEVIELINVLFAQMRAYNPVLWYPSRNYYERVLETLFSIYPNIIIAENKHATTQKNLLEKIRTKYGNNRRKEKKAIRYTTSVETFELSNKEKRMFNNNNSNEVLLI